MLNTNLGTYPLPLASEMPDMEIIHVTTPTRATALGARGVGEAGIVGAIGAMWTAVNDALAPLDTRVSRQPFTPEHLLDCLDKAAVLF
jgi:carbon-monoxide dehydrogenase large subunit